MKWKLILALLVFPAALFGQTLAGVNGDCQVGGQQALTSGLPSTATQQIGTSNVLQGAGVQASFPSCLVTVYATGTTIKANIFSNNNATPTPLVNPFTAGPDGGFTFFISPGACYDIVLASGSVPLPYSRTLADVCPGGTSGGGGGGPGGVGPGTTGTIPVFINPTAIGSSEGVSTGVSPVQWPLGVSLVSGALFINKCNNGTTGTVANLLVAFDAANCAIKAQPTDTNNLKGIARTTGIGGTADIAYAGSFPCQFDNQTAIGDWVVLGSGSQCHDNGATQPSGIEDVGRVNSVNAGAGTLAGIDMSLPDVTNTSAGNGTGIVSPCATPGALAFYQTISSKVFCDPALITNGAGGLSGVSVTLAGSGSGEVQLTNPSASPSDVTFSTYIDSNGRGFIDFEEPLGGVSSNIHLNPNTGQIVIQPPSGGADDGAHGVNISNSGLGIGGKFSDGVGLLVGAGNAVINGSGGSSTVLALGSTGVEGIFSTAPPSGGGSYTFRSPATSAANVLTLPNASGTFALTSNFAVALPIGSTTPNTGVFSTLTDSGITGMVQCVHVNSVGLMSGTGADCGAGGGGGVSSVSGTAGQIDVVNGSTTPQISLDPAVIFPGTAVFPTSTSLATTGSGTINGEVFANSSETVQQAMTAASTNGFSGVPTVYAGSDIPAGTRFSSRNLPLNSSQPSGAQVADYRYGGTATSQFNPGHDASGLNVWYGTSNLSWWNQNFGNSSNGGTNNVETSVFQNNVLFGGQNINQNGYTNKTDYGSIFSVLNSWASGESEGIKHYSNCYGTGDCTAMFVSVACFGGADAGSDEGCEGPDFAITQGSFEFLGTISGSPAAGATSITITPTQGTRSAGDGRFIIDSTQVSSTGTITSLSGQGLVTVTGSGTGWSTSTATTTTSAITVTGTNTTPGSVNVPVVSNAGFSIGNVICVSDTTTFQYSVVTAAPSGHITANFIKPFANGATIATGGLCGWGFNLPDDDWTTSGAVGFVTVNPPIRQVWPIVNSTSATTMVIQIQVAGAGDNYSGMAATPGASYHIFPMAQVIDVTGGTATVGSTMTISPNTITFANGDTVAVPVFPGQKHTGTGNWEITNLWPSQPLGPFRSGVGYNGIVSANDNGWTISNNTTLTKYAGHAGKLIVPNAGYDLVGLYNYGVRFELAPDRTAMYIACPLNSSGVQSCAGGPLVHMVDFVNGNGGSDYIAYNPTAGSEYWRFNFENGGHSCQIGQNANGISCDGHLRTGQNGLSSGVLDLMGATNGTATLTAPTAGATTSNPIASSNALQAPFYQTTTSCAASGTAANPSVVSCSAAPAGIVYCDIAASAGTCTINTTAVTTNSSITITPSTADGTLLSKTCNTSPSAMPAILLAVKVNGTSFTINMPTGVTNGFCFEYSMVN